MISVKIIKHVSFLYETFFFKERKRKEKKEKMCRHERSQRFKAFIHSCFLNLILNIEYNEHFFLSELFKSYQNPQFN